VKTDKENIKKSLHQRRQNSGCSMWRNVGVKYLGDRKMWDKMLDWEIELYKRELEEGYFRVYGF